MRRNLADAVVGRVGDPYAVARAGLGVDRVEARADAAHDAELGQRAQDGFGDRRSLQQDAGAAPRRGDDLAFRPAASDRELDSRVGEDLSLLVDVDVVVVGIQNACHRRLRSSREKALTVRRSLSRVKSLST